MTNLTAVKTVSQQKTETMLGQLDRAKQRVLDGKVHTLAICAMGNGDYSYWREGPDQIGLMGVLSFMLHETALQHGEDLSDA